MEDLLTAPASDSDIGGNGEPRVDWEHHRERQQ